LRSCAVCLSVYCPVQPAFSPYCRSCSRHYYFILTAQVHLAVDPAAASCLIIDHQLRQESENSKTLNSRKVSQSIFPVTVSFYLIAIPRAARLVKTIHCHGSSHHITTTTYQAFAQRNYH
jgi:hypothetical protein